ncbi:MAG: hypothetical protein ACTSRG_19860 [Candidatus Helarchaeota archaeon]
MGFKCLVCNRLYDTRHLPKKCICGNDERDKFIRIEDADIDPEKRLKDKEWLESRRINP